MHKEYEQEAPMDVYNNRLTARHARHARKIGDGDFSEGMRRAVEIAYEVLFKDIGSEQCCKCETCGAKIVAT
jgi:hypothetical protein